MSSYYFIALSLNIVARGKGYVALRMVFSGGFGKWSTIQSLSSRASRAVVNFILTLPRRAFITEEWINDRSECRTAGQKLILWISGIEIEMHKSYLQLTANIKIYYINYCYCDCNLLLSDEMDVWLTNSYIRLLFNENCPYINKLSFNNI